MLQSVVLPGGDSPSSRNTLQDCSEIAYPLEPEIELTLASPVFLKDFTLYLKFENHEGEIKLFALPFQKAIGKTLKPSNYPDMDVLESLADTNNRSYWDRMSLVRLFGFSDLSIEHLKIVMKYDGIPSTCETDIHIIDWSIDSVLPVGGSSSIGLDGFAVASRYKWAEIDFTESLLVFPALRDLGKSGSDGLDDYGDNPKYADGDSLLCG